jgi:hypothetical protein
VAPQISKTGLASGKARTETPCLCSTCSQKLDEHRYRHTFDNMFSNLMLPVFKVKETYKKLAVESGTMLFVKENRGVVTMAKTVLSARDVGV